MNSFYKRRSQKSKKYNQFVSLFVLLGFVGVKVARKMLVKFTPGGNPKK